MSIKRSKWAGLIALVGVLIGVAVAEGPAASAVSSVTGVSFAGSSSVGGATANWTVGFTTSNGNSGQLNPGDTIKVTFNSSFGLPATPAVSLASGFTNCTATASTGANVVTITLAGTGCVHTKNTPAGVVINGITNASVGTYPASTFSVATSGDTAPASPSAAVTLTAGAASKLVFVQGPSSGFAGTAFTPAITVQVQDQAGNAVSTSGIAVTLTPSTGVIDTGFSAATGSSGLATFSGVVINATALGITLTASAAGLTSTGPSSAFNVTVGVTNGAALTDTATDGSGSGVKSVAYYYCTGYSGTCTSSSWTAIGSSTTASGNYQVSWTSQPANGAYRIVAVSTDNVTNTSQPAASVPVTVTN